MKWNRIILNKLKILLLIKKLMKKLLQKSIKILILGPK